MFGLNRHKKHMAYVRSFRKPDWGKRAAITNKMRHGDDFYARIGALGGNLGHTGGFAANRELAREAGRKGGLISKRTK